MFFWWIESFRLYPARVDRPQPVPGYKWHVDGRNAAGGTHTPDRFSWFVPNLKPQGGHGRGGYFVFALKVVDGDTK